MRKEPLRDIRRWEIFLSYAIPCVTFGIVGYLLAPFLILYVSEPYEEFFFVILLGAFGMFLGLFISVVTSIRRDDNWLKWKEEFDEEEKKTRLLQQKKEQKQREKDARIIKKLNRELPGIYLPEADKQDERIDALLHGIP